MSVSDDSIGEASHTREDGDDDRPLKKARFAWQVKGKHHLRRDQESDSEAEEAAAASPPTAAPVPSRAQQSSSGGGRVGVRPCTAWEERERRLEMWERDLNHEDEDLPTLLNHRQNRREDSLLHLWQARQLAKCAVDNTINRVLDTWSVVMRARGDCADAADTCGAADASDAPAHSVEVENEGILMAISAHGLTTPRPIHRHVAALAEQASCAHQDLEIVQVCSPCSLPDDPLMPYLDKLTSSIAVDPEPASDRTESEFSHRASESPQRGYEYESPPQRCHEPQQRGSESAERGNESPQGVYEFQQRGYEFQQRGYESQQRGAEPQQRGGESAQRGFESPQRCYKSQERGYESHKPQQRGYESTQRSYESQQRRYKSQQMGYESQQRGYVSPQRRYESQEGSYKSQQRGYESPQRRYDSPQRGAESPQRVYDSLREVEFPTPDEIDADEHFSFIDAAITFAIQHKGLTSLASGNG